MDKTERRQQILVHARDVFSKRGYHAAKIDDIVAAAGVARGTFYLYFEDKRAIFEEIVDRVLARIGMAILRVDPHDPSRSVPEQIKENIRRVVGILLEDGATTKIVLSDAVGVDPLFDRKLHSFYDEVSSLLEASLRDGQALGIVVEGDARVFSHLTLGALKELLYQVVLRGWEHPGEQIVDEIFQFLRGGYLRVDLEPKSVPFPIKGEKATVKDTHVKRAKAKR
jgi:AcrR family transcriptional regulator